MEEYYRVLSEVAPLLNAKRKNSPLPKTTPQPPSTALASGVPIIGEGRIALGSPLPLLGEGLGVRAVFGMVI